MVDSFGAGAGGAGAEREVVERQRGLYVSRTMASRVHGNLMSLPAPVKPP